MKALVAASLWAFCAWPPAAVEAGLGDLRDITSVDVEAPLYDSKLSDENGCDPSGCVGELTRDSDFLTPGSRWSCKPSLGPAGSTCSITYTLGIEVEIIAINVALYKGDERTRTMDVYVDDTKVTSWTSSGNTDTFETFDLGATGQVIELRGVLEDDEWLSIKEVEFIVEDLSIQYVELADHLTTVTVSAPLYDTKLAEDGGCDPEGCVASNAQDGDMTSNSRWSCAPKLGGTCILTYTLGEALDLWEVRVALYKGDTRFRTLEVYVDGVYITDWTSSGMTEDFENIHISGTNGRVVDIVGVLDESEWISILEAEVLVVLYDPVPATSVTSVTTSAPLYDTKLAVDGGCDPEGCTASNTLDRNMEDTSRWSCMPKLGGTCSISYTFGMALDLSEVRLALYNGDARVRTIEVYVDGVLITTWTSSGTTNNFEGIDLSGTSGTVLELVGVLGYSDWLSIIETNILVSAPTVTPNEDYQLVGLLPLADGYGTDLERYYIKDGDFSTSWTCTGDPKPDNEQYYDCTISISLFSYRHVKQVKIALPDGAGAHMRLTAEDYGNVLVETFVTSSGSADADGFETFNFDAFTNGVNIAGVFASNGLSITISEVEILEEVQPGEVSVARFDTPFGEDLWTGPTTDAFEWFSDSDEALDRTLAWMLNSYATVDAVELQFPQGDTYKFELEVKDGDDDNSFIFTGFESQDTAGWQSFDLSLYPGDYATEIWLVMKGTGSGAPGFKLLDARFMGTPIDNPSDTFSVGSTRLEDWNSDRYPDFVGEGSGDQKAIMGAICAVKKAEFDGVDCVGGDDAATGTVELTFGEWFVDGNIFMKSGVFLDARFSIDDAPYTTDILVEEGASGKTDVDAIVVMDGISNARIDDLWIRGRYDPDSNDPATPGFGSVGVSIVGSSNVTCTDSDIRYIDGDGVVVRNSQMVNLDAGRFDEEYPPWSIGIGRGTGILVDSSDAVWVRRHDVYDHGVAGIHIMGSNNFTFEATIADECFGDNCVLEGEGNVGRVDGQQQPIEVIIETSTDVKFHEMRVESLNDPVMTVSGSSGVSFDECGFSNVAAGTCVIKVLDTDSEVETGGDPELSLEQTPDGPCWVKV